MSLKVWLNKGTLQKIEIDSNRLENLLKIVDRDLKDASVTSISHDRRFANAYGAALNLASYVINKNGFRVTRLKHHQMTFEVAGFILGQKAKKHTEYFDYCRRKRNKIDYNLVDVVYENDVREIISVVRQFRDIIFH